MKRHIEGFDQFNENWTDDLEFEDFLSNYAEDNFGFDPDGNPAYYAEHHQGVISMGTVVNPKFKPFVPNFDKDEMKKSMIELANDLIYNIEEKFNKTFYIEFTIINDKKHGFILRSR